VKHLKRNMLLGIGGVVVALVAWTAADRVYFKPSAAIRAERDALRERTQWFESSARGVRETRLALREIASTMLGREQTVVEHRLRGLLSDLAAREGLGEVVVTHGRPRGVENPAQDRGSGVSRGLRRLLGERPDFAVLQARLKGEGTLEQTLRTLASVRAQAWAHRIEGFSISPKGREQRVFELKIDLATVFAGDLAIDSADGPALVGVEDSTLALVQRLVARQPFHLATPVAAAPPASAPPTPVNRPPPAPPYDRWRVTGVLETRDAVGVVVEVMLSRTDTGEMRTLRIGDGVLGASLVEAAGETAVFELAGRRVAIRTGQTLAQGVTVDSVHSDGKPQG
jgi:hypothetical protein